MGWTVGQEVMVCDPNWTRRGKVAKIGRKYAHVGGVPYTLAEGTRADGWGGSIMSLEAYDLQQRAEVARKALRAFGVECNWTMRDVTVLNVYAALQPLMPPQDPAR
jgi:hypothetical protein